MKRTWFLSSFFVLVGLAYQTASTQMLSYSRGQNVSPAFEGWEKNDDGSFNMMFGYMNRNWEEEVDVPVGPDNNISPGRAGSGTADALPAAPQPLRVQGARARRLGQEGTGLDADHEGQDRKGVCVAARRLARRQHRPGVGAGRARRRRQQPGDSRQRRARNHDRYRRAPRADRPAADVDRASRKTTACRVRATVPTRASRNASPPRARARPTPRRRRRFRAAP